MVIFSNDFLSNFSRKYVSVGGPARFAYEFSEYAIRQGHEWIGLSFEASKGKRVVASRVVFNKKVYWKLRFDYNIFKQITQAKKRVNPEKITAPIIVKIRTLLKASKPDIVFINGFSLFNWVIMKAAIAEDIKIVIQHAGILTKEVQVYADFFSEAGCKILLKMEKDISDYVAQEVFLNEYSRSIYNKLVRKVPASKNTIIPLPFLGQKSGKSGLKNFYWNKKLDIGIIARWDRIKNYQAVLKLAQKIKQENLPWQIFAVTYIPETRDSIDFKNQFRQNVKVVAPMSAYDIPKFIRKMDIMILPSKFDSAGAVVMEAAAEGVATFISPQVGWVNEYSRNNCQEMIVDFENPSDVIRRIKKINNYNWLRKTNRMFDNILQKHNKNDIFHSYITLFKNL